MPNQAISPAAGPTADQIDRILNQMADSFGQQLRSPIWHSPSEEKPGLRGCHFSVIGLAAGIRVAGSNPSGTAGV